MLRDAQRRRQRERSLGQPSLETNELSCARGVAQVCGGACSYVMGSLVPCAALRRTRRRRFQPRSAHCLRPTGWDLPRRLVPAVVLRHGETWRTGRKRNGALLFSVFLVSYNTR